MIFKRLLTGFIFLVSAQDYYSQCSNLSVVAGTNANLVTETLYEENFTGQTNKGAYGSNLDISDCDWTIDVSSATLSNSSDWFKVNSSEQMEGQDTWPRCVF